MSEPVRKLGKLLRLLASAEGRRGLVQGVAMTTEHLAPLRGLSPATVIDVGANKGQFALAALALWPAARVIALEPMPDAARSFRALFADDPRVRLIAAAAGDRSGDVALHLSARRDSSSLLPIGARQSEVFPGTEETGTVEVPVAPLAELLGKEPLDPPVLLKIDVQGAELAVLAGAAPLLDRLTAVYVECSYLELYEGQALAGDVEGLLAERGFRLAGRFNLVSHPRYGEVQADLLFLRDA
jgi:FkbM family methyltransferase